MASDPVTIALVLAPRYPLMSLAACTESLRIANRELGFIAFDRLMLTTDDSVAMSSSGIPLSPEATLEDTLFAPVALVLSSYHPEEACRPDFLAWLRRQSRMGSIIGCVDTASYILIKAGVLGEHEVAVHRESLPGYQELLSHAALLDRYFVIDGQVVSSAGGMATLDMMLGLIARFQGREIAGRVAYVLNYRPLPEGASSDETSVDGLVTRVDRRLACMIKLMQTNLEEPLPLAVVYERARVPSATASRLFSRFLHMTPGQYYMRIRLERAQSLLANSPLPIGEVAGRVGFDDASAFTRAFRRHFGKPPSASRR